MTHRTPVVRNGQPARQFAYGLALVALLTLACGGGEDPLVAKSKQVLTEQMQANPQHAGYALAISAKSQAPFARQMLVEWISSDHYPTAMEAVKAIAGDPPEEARTALRQVFDTKKGLLRLNAAIALAQLGDEEALGVVRSEVLEGGGTLTLPAVRLLVEQGDQAAVEALLRKRLDSDEPTVRNEVYSLVGELGQPWAEPLLLTAIEKESGADRQQPILALGQCGEPQAAGKIEKYINTKGLVFATLEALGWLGNPESAKVVVKHLDHENALVRVYAATALWRLGEEGKARPVAEALASDTDPTVRLNLAQQLRGIDSPAALGLLGALLEDEETEVRVSAARSLAEAEDPGTEAILLDALDDASYEVTTIALDVLGRIGSAGAVDRIAPLLDNRIPYVAMSAANAILEIKARTGSGTGSA